MPGMVSRERAGPQVWARSVRMPQPAPNPATHPPHHLCTHPGSHPQPHPLPPPTCPCCSQPGEYASETGSHVCNVCPPGNYTDAPAQPICKFCGAGKYTINVNGKGATGCSECAKGTWKPAAAMDNKCRSCPAGYETKVDGTGASACTPCDAGYFGRLPNTALCAKCTPGTFAATSGEQDALGSLPGAVRGCGRRGCIHRGRNRTLASS